jgi:hypothetical protein
MKKIVIVVLILTSLSLCSAAQQKHKTENVILITLDGLRWQEVFTGAESRLLLNKKYVGDTVATHKLFWRETPQQRREVLMPFFWNVIAKQGQLYGNRLEGNMVNVTNKMWFSYPGYNEILTGAADDINITSNDPNDNPNQTVLELLNNQKEFQGKVAAFSSWETFPWIINTSRSAIPVNAGYKTVTVNPTERETLMNELMFQLPNESGGTRPDAFTFHYAFEHLKKNTPRVLFISFDETDHFAHEGEYDRYLAATRYIDGFIKSLWEWVQSQPDYQNKTTLIVTTDHGRGDTAIDDWRHHGSKMPHCDQIWFAFIGPDTAPLGEVKADRQLYQNQLATTIASLLGVEWKSDKKKGEALEAVVGNNK